MYTTKIDLLENIFKTLTNNRNQIEISHELEMALNKNTGFYNCAFYDEKLNTFSLVFEGELNITKCINDEIEIDNDGCFRLKHEYFEGKINHLGQECLKSYTQDFEYNNKIYTISILEYFGQIRNNQKGRYDGFKTIAIQLPDEILCHL